ncbi:DUF1835 domain-containing protein [Marinicrinis lubricantis]|uniref:DUF1835 domain-containing protein n=1 Tax=Marinicrinis lubricantis TaxID=2086470 RepID=A0ABW1IR54_9BACL
MIHIVNGDIVGEKLIHQVEGEVIVWREMYDYGPLLSKGSREEHLRRRAAFFEEKVGIPAKLFMESCEQQYRKLDELPRDTEVTLWFEHDRYDQMMLIYLITELNNRGFQKLSMVTLNEYSGIEPFYGMGQLSSLQLKELGLTHHQSLTPDQLQEAVEAWTAYTSENPLDTEQWIKASGQRLPFLTHAMQRHLRYYPSVHTGLNEIEDKSLRYIGDRACTFEALFEHISRSIPHDGLSDLQFAAILNQLTRGDFPLLDCDGPLPNYGNPNSSAMLRLTSSGKQVLQGNRDRFSCTGIDWWLGGVHLQDGSWRWDGERLIFSL